MTNSLCLSSDMHFTDQIVYVNNWRVIERTASKSNEWLLGKNTYPVAVHTFKECDFFSPLHTKITDLKHDDMMN